MHVLIVESTPALAGLWQRHIQRQGAEVLTATTSDSAMNLIATRAFSVIVIDLVLSDGSALAVADYAQYRQPGVPLIFVTDTTFFSDGSIFSMIPNVRAFIRCATPPEDIAAMVAHWGAAA